MNALPAIFNYRIENPAVADFSKISNTLDKKYRYMSDEDVRKFYPRFWELLEVFGLDKYKADVNDCDNFAYLFVDFLKAMHMRDIATPLACASWIVNPEGKTHVVVLVFHSAAEWTHYDVQGGQISVAKINYAYNLERV